MHIIIFLLCSVSQAVAAKYKLQKTCGPSNFLDCFQFYEVRAIEKMERDIYSLTKRNFPRGETQLMVSWSEFVERVQQ